MSKFEMPPYMQTGDKVILFDGVCKLCNAWSRFIIKYDMRRVFKLASVQSVQGKAILEHFGYQTDYYKTMLYAEDNRVYEKSTAFLRIVRLLPQPIRMLSVFRILPTGVRDWLYDRIALNRYRIFGKYDQCILPISDHMNRFL